MGRLLRNRMNCRKVAANLRVNHSTISRLAKVANIEAQFHGGKA